MRIMIDADLILGMLLKRKVFSLHLSNEFWDLLKEKVEGHMTEIGLNKISVVINTFCGFDVAEEIISELQFMLTICPITPDIRQELHLSKLIDHESALEYACTTANHLAWWCRKLF